MFRLLYFIFILLSFAGKSSLNNNVRVISEDILRENNYEDCKTKTCIRKCCDVSEYITNDQTCKPSNNKLDINVTIYEGKELLVNTDIFLVLPPFETRNIIDAPNNNKYHWCNGTISRLELNVKEDFYRIQKSGVIILENRYGSPEVKLLDYCVDQFEDLGTSTVIICEDYAITNSIGMMISLPFLLVTFFVYAFTPELRNLHGLCLMCYVASLFVAYVFLIAIQVGHKTISAGFCTNAPFIIYFAFMVSFLWLNVMCVDIWWTFSGRRGFVGSVRQSEKKRFLIYSIYAWGVALIMVSITALMQYTDLPMHLVKPNFGKGRCWFDGFHSTLYYFYGPMMLLIIINICLFAWTTFLIYQVKRETSRSMRMESHRTGDDSDKQRSSYQFKQNRKFIGDTKIDRFKLYLKLSLVFGVNWSMEILSWLVGGYKEIWYLTDLCNALYGVLIFFIFVCKANVWKLAKKRYYSLMGRPYRAHSYAPTSDNNTRSTGAGDSYAMTTEANNH